MIILFVLVLLSGLGALGVAALLPVLATRPRPLYVVSFSSGVSSAVAARRAIDRYGAGNTLLVFMDTTWEDEDNYRFMRECSEVLNTGIVTLRDGRTPLDVARQEHIIPNSLVAPCTYRLKIEPFLNYVTRWQSCGYEITILLGMNWTETHRMDAPRRNYGARGFDVDYPLMWKPYDLDMFATVRSWGIEPPRMYRLSYSHANCGGRCVKQGQGDWLRTLTHFPDRFEEVAAWEERQRLEPVNADYTILKDRRNGEIRALSLYMLRALQLLKRGDQLSLWPAAVEDDTTFCLCNAGDPGEVAR